MLSPEAARGTPLPAHAPSRADIQQIARALHRALVRGSSSARAAALVACACAAYVLAHDWSAASPAADTTTSAILHATTLAFTHAPFTRYTVTDALVTTVDDDVNLCMDEAVARTLVLRARAEEPRRIFIDFVAADASVSVTVQGSAVIVARGPALGRARVALTRASEAADPSIEIVCFRTARVAVAGAIARVITVSDATAERIRRAIHAAHDGDNGDDDQHRGRGA